MVFKTANVERIFKTMSMRNRRKKQAGVGAVSQASGSGERCAEIGSEEASVVCLPPLAVLSEATPLLVWETHA